MISRRIPELIHGFVRRSNEIQEAKDTDIQQCEYAHLGL